MNAYEWNEKHPIGTRVRYFPIIGERPFREAATRSEAWTLGSGHSIVKIDGIAGGVHLNHLEVVAAAAPPGKTK